MCGIFGLVATGEDRRLTLSARHAVQALRLQRHRGPDRSRLSFFSDHGAITVSMDSDVSYIPPAHTVLGHNRLSIIDLSTQADQPMPFGELYLSYNGEIYNYKDLKAVLEETGYHFESASDTEVLLALYAAYGPEMVHRLNGMFAFGLWDNAREKLFLARDRYGIKPLYYTRLSNGAFAFSSEIKSLLALPGIDKTLDDIALSEHLTFQNMLEGRTLLRHIHLLEPGHRAILDARSGQLTIEPYWEPIFIPDTSRHEVDLIAQLRDTFEQAVKAQLVGDVPIGSFLSGGMDTGAITAIATRHIPDLHTFTAGFEVTDLPEEEQRFDERAVSHQLADLFNTRHHEMRIDANALPAVLPNVVWHLDDFRAGISYQNFLVSRMVQQSATVVLSGVGGDELFAGYPWRYEPVLHLQHDAFSDHYYQSWSRILTENEKDTLWTPEIKSRLNGFSTRDSFNRVLEKCQADDPLNKALCYDFKTFLHGLLIVEDRLSMAHSIESRVPFLDNHLVDLCLTLPPNTKLRNGNAKWILKEALRGLLPEEVLTRRKQGFTPPDASWYRGEMRPYIENLLLSEQALSRGLFTRVGLQSVLEAHFSGQRNHRFLLWSLMCLEWWHRLLIDPPTPQAPDTLAELTGAHIL